MPRYENPIVVVTRPSADAELFVDMLRQEAGKFEAIFSPAFDYETVATPLPDFDYAIFTSRTGVAHAPEGRGRRAFCVGEATALAAKERGYAPESSGGSADELVAMILNRAPEGALVHIRGEVSRGDVAGRLIAGGLKCADAIVYRKTPKPPNAEVNAATGTTRAVIFPLFSGETVSILNAWGVSINKCIVVAISAEVGEASAVLAPMQVVISERPDLRSMVRATARMIA